MTTSRRNFIKTAALATAGLATSSITDSKIKAQTSLLDKKRTSGSKDGKIRVGFIGTGFRSQEHFNNILSFPDTVVTAICDVSDFSINMTKETFKKREKTLPKIYQGGDLEYEKMLRNEDFDVVIISSPWEWHVPMAVASMKAGVPYVGLEVSAANTMKECWELVDTSEQTGSNLMILENVCYRRDAMAALKMVREGIFGEIIHCRCGYEHDLRNVKFNDGKSYFHTPGAELKMGKGAIGEAVWRTFHSIERNGDLYPTHGIGPVGNWLDINFGNRFLSLSAMATKSRGLNKYIVDNGGKNHPYANIDFKLGDIVTSMINTVRGETIIVTHDTNSPRPYSLGFRLQGTQGLWYNDGNTIHIEGKSEAHRWDKSSDWFDKYDHPLWQQHGEAAQNAGHGGMDYIMMIDFFNAIREKRPAPLDCYDAAAWSAISALSEESIAGNGKVVSFPDFTRGKWINRKPHFALH